MLLKNRISGMVAVVMLLLVCAGGASAQNWNRAEGRPDNFENNDRLRAGFYIWHEGDTVFVVHNRAQDRRVSGDISVSDGTIRNPRGFSNQNDRRFQVRSPRRLRFDYTAADKNDGVKFQWDGTGTITIRTNINRGSETYYVGRERSESESGIIRIRRNNNGNDDDRFPGGGNRFPGGSRDDRFSGRPSDDRFPGGGDRFPGRDNPNDGYNDDYGRPAEGSWRDIEGRPENIERASGIYVWREGNTVHIAFARRGFGGSRVSGSIRVENGTIRNPRGFRDERNDHIVRRGDDRIQFNLDRGDNLDGIKFDVSTKSQMFIRVQDNGRENRYFLGSGKRRIEDGTLLIK